MGLLTPRRLLLAMLIVGAHEVQSRASAAAGQPPNYRGWYADNGSGHHNQIQPTSAPAGGGSQASSGQGDWGGQQPHRPPQRREQPHQQPDYYPHQPPAPQNQGAPPGHGAHVPHQYDQRPSGLAPGMAPPGEELVASGGEARVAPVARDPAASSGKSSKNRGNSWEDAPPEDYSNVDKEKIFRALWDFYRKRVLPLEIAYQYEHFEGKTMMTEADFMSKPMVLLLGPYSVGKTSFIRSLIKCDFPGQNIGPEPTTDKFTAVMYGRREQAVPGHRAVLQPDKPFSALARAKFGSDFLNRFEVAEVPSAFLKEVMLVDTPGILSGEKQRQGRGYMYEDVVRWFADRADRIVIMFDAHKLDISDELRKVMECIREHQDKIRILLNKADSINAQQLMRVYGALMWQLGKVVDTPESSRVYISSFWEGTIRNVESRALLEREKHDLLKELHELPNNAVNRRINELYKRIRSVRVHCFLIHHLRKKMPRMWGKEAKMRELLHTLHKEMQQCAAKTKYRVASGDLPQVKAFGDKLSMVDIRKYDKLDKSKVVKLDQEFSDYLSAKLKEARIQPPGSAPSSSWR